MKAGVLALQGDFREHGFMFAAVGATPVEVRTAEDLAEVGCLAIPGGESTAIARLARTYGLEVRPCVATFGVANGATAKINGIAAGLVKGAPTPCSSEGCGC